MLTLFGERGELSERDADVIVGTIGNGFGVKELVADFDDRGRGCRGVRERPGVETKIPSRSGRRSKERGRLAQYRPSEPEEGWASQNPV